MRKIIAATLLVLVALALLAAPVLASLIWHHGWEDGTKVFRGDLGPFADKFQVYGYTGAVPLGGYQKWARTCSCPLIEDRRLQGERIQIKILGNGNPQALCICAKMTETPCPTMEP